MKQKLASFALLLPLLLAVSCGNKQQGPVTLNKEGLPELNSVLDTLSWAYGQNIADVLMNQPVFDSLDAAVVLQSAQHAIAGGKQPLTVEETKAALNYLLAMHNAAVQQQVEAQEQTVSQQQQKIMDEAMKSNPKLKKHPSGFLYECLKEGKGPKVQYAQRIRFDYKSFLMLTGEPYDQTYGKRDPIVHVVGEPTADRSFSVFVGCRRVLATDITSIRRAWSETTYRMQALRDNPASAKEEYDNGLDETDPGLSFKLTYDPDEAVGRAPRARRGEKPRMAILREQGVNGHIEMAAAFALAGFESVDVHMTDLLAGRVDLADFQGLVACGGFSYGDVLGAGSGWARSILFNRKLKAMFKKFFHRKDTFSLGVCNGCQMLSQLKDIIPGAEAWPEFKRNISEQFEARYCTLEVLESPSIFFKGMAGSRIPIAVAHGEGRAVFPDGVNAEKAKAALRYVDGRGHPTERYPWNPNGSAGGLTSFTTRDGRATIMMPHPERGFRAAQLSYNPGVFTGEAGPWMRMFRNAYAFATR